MVIAENERELLKIYSTDDRKTTIYNLCVALKFLQEEKDIFTVIDLLKKLTSITDEEFKFLI